MASPTLDQLIARLEAAGVVRASELRGCSEVEMAEMQRQVSGPLPAAYHEFMQRMGVEAGDFCRGTDWFYPIVLGNRELAEDLLAEDTDPPFELTRSHFVFASHQGYSILFFDVLKGSDPPVYRYVEGEAAPELVLPSFSAWLQLVVDDWT